MYVCAAGVAVSVVPDKDCTPGVSNNLRFLSCRAVCALFCAPLWSIQAVPAPTLSVAEPAPAPAATAPAASTAAPAPAAAAASAAAATPSAPAASPFAGPEFEAAVEAIKGMGYEEAQIRAALNAAFGNPDRAGALLVLLTTVLRGAVCSEELLLELLTPAL